MSAYFISPKGELIYVPMKHINMVLSNPEKFGMNRDIIDYIYGSYNERLGQEGKAREQILISLINQGWIRIRKYGDKFWSVNVNKLTRKVKQHLQKWAKAMIKGRDGIKEYDKTIPVNIDVPKKRVTKSDIGSIADSSSFVTESKEELKFVDIEDIEDRPIYECFEKYLTIIKHLKGSKK